MHPQVQRLGGGSRGDGTARDGLLRCALVRIAALSDFHIGATARTCGFRHSEAAFGRYLDRLEAEHDAIVLLGDIYQTDHGRVPSRASARRHLHRARARVPALVERFDAAPYHYVFGNHDEIAGEALAAPERLLLGSEGARVLLTHGHQYDPIARRAPLAADAGTWFTGRLRYAGLRPVAAWLERRDVAVKDRRFRGADGPYARGGLELARGHKAQFVVMGHTHCPRVDRLGDITLVNSGTCSDGRYCHVSIDTEAGTAEVRLL